VWWVDVLEGYEMIAILAILAIIFLWGPQKLPEMARSIGLAKREFDNAAKEASSLANPSSIINPQTSAGTSTPATTQSPQPPQDPLVVAAKSLGISTEGKTKEELAREIVARTAVSSVQPSEKETSAAVAGK
jgi:sec-independent protein translocase protein TatA